MLKFTPQTIYKLITKGKIQKVKISTINKPGVTSKIRVQSGEVAGWGGVIVNEVEDVEF